jgi:hypothetical protein
VAVAFSAVNRFCTALLCGRAGSLTAKNDGFRPWKDCGEVLSHPLFRYRSGASGEGDTVILHGR